MIDNIYGVFWRASAAFSWIFIAEDAEAKGIFFSDLFQ
jgi:hypothetical protein